MIKRTTASYMQNDEKQCEDRKKESIKAIEQFGMNLVWQGGAWQ